MQVTKIDNLSEAGFLKLKAEKEGRPFFQIHVGQLELVDLTGKMPPLVGGNWTHPGMDISPTPTKKNLTQPNAIIVFYGLKTAFDNVQEEFHRIIESLPETTEVCEAFNYK
jgi:hypothetical protein